MNRRKKIVFLYVFIFMCTYLKAENSQRQSLQGQKPTIAQSVNNIPSATPQMPAITTARLADLRKGLNHVEPSPPAAQPTQLENRDNTLLPKERAFENLPDDQKSKLKEISFVTIEEGKAKAAEVADYRSKTSNPLPFVFFIYEKNLCLFEKDAGKRKAVFVGNFDRFSSKGDIIFKFYHGEVSALKSGFVEFKVSITKPELECGTFPVDKKDNKKVTGVGSIVTPNTVIPATNLIAQ